MTRRKFLKMCAGGALVAAVGLFGGSFAVSELEYNQINNSIKTANRLPYSSLDAAIITGYGVNPPGTITPVGITRAFTGWELYQSKRVKKLIATGGFVNPAVKDKSEAAVIRDYLLHKGGISSNDIILDENAYTHAGNAVNSKDYTEKNNWYKIAVIVNDFNLPRAKFIFDKVFGKKYDIEYHGANSRMFLEELGRSALTYEEYQRLLVDERFRFFIFRTILTGISDGDNEGIKRRFNWLRFKI